MDTIAIVFIVVNSLIIYLGVYFLRKRNEGPIAQMEDEILSSKIMTMFEKAIVRYGRTTNGFGKTNIECYAQALVNKYEHEFHRVENLIELKKQLNQRLLDVTNNGRFITD